MTAATIPVPQIIPGDLSRWREILIPHYLRLSQQSRRLRFMAAMKDCSIHQIAGATNPTCVLGVRIDGKMRGVFEIFLSGKTRAEIGMSVEDAYQGQGYGRQLFLAGFKQADQLGITIVDFHFDPQNNGIKRLVMAAGATIQRLDHAKPAPKSMLPARCLSLIEPVAHA